MWNEIEFMYPSRAAFIAYTLKERKYQVKWNPVMPEILEVFGDEKKIRNEILEIRGVDNEWYLKAQIIR